MKLSLKTISARAKSRINVVIDVLGLENLTDPQVGNGLSSSL